jgi:hypothetical protein
MTVGRTRFFIQMRDDHPRLGWGDSFPELVTDQPEPPNFAEEWGSTMQDARRLRARAAMCLEIARQISSKKDADHLRGVADSYLCDAQRMEAAVAGPTTVGQNMVQAKHRRRLERATHGSRVGSYA